MLPIRIVVFVFLLNMSIGVLSLVPGLDLTQYPQNTGGLTYDVDYSDEFNNIIRQDTSIDNDNTAGFFNSVLDIIGLGFINKILDLINKFFYGFISQLLKPIFGPFLGEPTSTIIFGIFYSVNTIIYAFGALTLFSRNQIDVTSR
jgi:uncharacterized membrane protein required for colicin V production